MAVLHSCAPFLQTPSVSLSLFSRQKHCLPPFWAIGGPFRSCYGQPKTSVLVAKAGRGQKLKSQEKSGGEDGGFGDEEGEGEDGFSSGSGFVGRGEGKEFDRDPEYAEIMGACLDDPQKARSKMEERLRKNRNKILLTKSGSGEPMRVVFNE